MKINLLMYFNLKMLHFQKNVNFHGPGFNMLRIGWTVSRAAVFAPGSFRQLSFGVKLWRRRNIAGLWGLLNKPFNNMRMRSNCLSEGKRDF